MTAQELIHDLQKAGYRFEFDAGKLKYRGKKHLSTEKLEMLKQYKPEIIRLLQESDQKQMPTLSEGDVRIPFDCPARYHWWDDRIEGKLSLKEIRAELRAHPANN